MRMPFRKEQPTVSGVHVNRPLTDISVAFLQNQDDFVASRVFPMVPVQKQSDLYYVYNRGDWNRVEAQKRAPGTESAGSGWNLSTAAYFADKWAIHKDVSDDVRANADTPLRPDQEATEYVTQQCMLRQEVEWFSNYFTTGIWGTDNPATGWNTTGTPIEDLRNGMIAVKAATGFKPNTLVLTPNTKAALEDNDDFLDRIKYTQTGIITEAIIAAVLGLDRVMTAWAVQNTAIEGAAEASAFIAGSEGALLCYAAPSPSLMTPSAGYTFAWTGLLGAGAAGNRIKRFRMEHLESDRVECEMAWDQKVVASELGMFFNNPLA